MTTTHLIGLGVCTAIAGGCSMRAKTTSEMVELLMPQEMRIVEAFSRFTSFDDDGTIDGIELMLQPVDSFGDPVKIAGSVDVELYEFVQASAEPEGRRVLPPWRINLQTRDDQKRYWNRVTGMYEIPLKLPEGNRPDKPKFVLTVTYHTPIDTNMTDRMVLDPGPRIRAAGLASGS